MSAFDDAPRSTECDHAALTHRWRGFEPPVKNLRRYHGPCGRCGDNSCKVSGGARVDAYVIRAAQLAARYGFELPVEASGHAHGIDLQCDVPGAATLWIWEFTRDDPAAVAQAAANRDHILGYLRERGVDARPGPAFEEPQWARSFLASFPPGRATRVRSHPTEAGIEVFDVFRCGWCATNRRWLYVDLPLRTERLTDLRMTQMTEGVTLWRGRPVRPPQRRRTPKGSPHQRAHLQLSLHRPAGDWPADALRSWFTEAISLVPGDRLDAMLAAPPEGFFPYKVPGVPGTPAATVRTATDRDPDWELDFSTGGVQLTEASWQSFLDGLATPPAAARIWFGTISKYGWAEGSGERPFLSLTSRFHTPSRDTLTLTAEFAHRRLRKKRFQRALLRVARAVAERVDPGYGEIGYCPTLSEIPAQTMLERLLYLDPSDTVGSATTLRGYSWLTICSAQAGDRLGGLAALRASGAFHRVERLATGAYWLLATRRHEDYDEVAARQVFGVLAPALPSGRPARAFLAEPHLITVEDARSVG